MTTPHHLPWDAARCRGVLSADPAAIYRKDCETCLRLLAPGHPDPERVQYVTTQPAPCPHHIHASYE